MTRPPATPASGPPIWTPGAPVGIPVGGVIDWPGHLRKIPPTWLETYGQSLLRLQFDALYNALVYMIGTASITAASPAVFSAGVHGLVVGDAVFLETISGVTGLTADLTYYVMTVPTSSTFTLGTTRTITASTGNAVVTTAVNTGGSAGLCFVFHAPYGVADSTHFYAPDYRGRDGIGMDVMGGSDGGVIPWSNVPGLPAGEALHTSLSTESGVPAHTHPSLTRVVVAPIGGGNLGSAGSYNETTVPITANTPADAASGHNTIQPGLAVRKIIYAGSTA
jgi:hypothetical protein